MKNPKKIVFFNLALAMGLTLYTGGSFAHPFQPDPESFQFKKTNGIDENSSASKPATSSSINEKAYSREKKLPKDFEKLKVLYDEADRILSEFNKSITRRHNCSCPASQSIIRMLEQVIIDFNKFLFHFERAGTDANSFNVSEFNLAENLGNICGNQIQKIYVLQREEEIYELEKKILELEKKLDQKSDETRKEATVNTSKGIQPDEMLFESVLEFAHPSQVSRSNTQLSNSNDISEYLSVSSSIISAVNKKNPYYSKQPTLDQTFSTLKQAYDDSDRHLTNIESKITERINSPVPASQKVIQLAEQMKNELQQFQFHFERAGTTISNLNLLELSLAREQFELCQSRVPKIKALYREEEIYRWEQELLEQRRKSNEELDEKSKANETLFDSVQEFPS